MIRRALPLLTLVIALYGPPIAAHLSCNSYEVYRDQLTGPPWVETERSTWRVEKLTYRHYRNDRTGTYTILVTWEVRPGVIGACVVASGTGVKELEL